MPDASRISRRERERRADGIYEITIGIIGERKLTNNGAAVELIHDTLRTRREEFFTRRGVHDGDALLRELAAAVAERLTADGLIKND